MTLLGNRPRFNIILARPVSVALALAFGLGGKGCLRQSIR